MAGKVSAAAGRLLVWWPPLFALWILFAGEWTWQTGLWGAGLSLAAAVGGVVAANLGLFAVQGQWRWVLELPSAAAAVAVDFGIVTGVLVRAVASRRREAGRFGEDDSAAGDDPLAAGRRAWVEMVASWSPNCYVIDISPHSGRRLIHDLRPHRPSERPA